MIGIPRRALVARKSTLPAHLTPRAFSPVPYLLPFRSQRILPGRYTTTSSKPDETGHINTAPNEAVFYVDNILPLKLTWLPRIPYLDPNTTILQRLGKFGENIAVSGPRNIIQQALPEEFRHKITGVIPRYSEGGAFVKVSHPPETTGAELAEILNKYLDKHPVWPRFSLFGSVRAALVRGRPWIEDLRRFPSTRVKVEFLPTSPGESAVELTPETIYSLMRRYGKLADIVPQASDSKVQPRYALLDFTRPGYAVMAKNCLHGFKVSEAEGGGKAGTLLKITYEARLKPHLIRDWIFSHPRIVVPVVAAILAAITVAIFDPIRTFFIKVRIAPPLDTKDSRILQWIQSQANRANDMFSSFRNRPTSESGGLQAIWEDRKDDIDRIENWLLEATNTFIVVQGPRGSGKKELVLGEALADFRHKLVIDCKPIQEARSDSATIAAAASEVGYRPVFSWMNNISSLIDTATQTLGANAGLSETLDSQLGHILQNTATALKKVAIEKRKRDGKDANLTDDEYLEAHPECRPVIIIDNFLHKSTENPMIFEKLADWAAALTYSNIGRVIFLTSDISYSKMLTRALPNQVFHEIGLGDCTPEVAKQFVLDHLHTDNTVKESDTGEDVFLEELDGCIKTVGGRLSDLEFLARMISRGQSPQSAVRDIIKQSAAEVLKMFIVDVEHSTKAWSPEQAWDLISKLAAADGGSILYSRVALSPMFKKDTENTISALEQAELISVTTQNGRPSTIKPGRPVYAAAFKRLVEDEVLRCRLSLRTLSRLISMENENIQKYEGELQVLGSLPKEPKEVRPRVKWLLGGLASSQANIEQYEAESSQLKKVLQSKA